VNTWALILVCIATSLLIVFPAVGLYLYSPGRARMVRHAEAFDEQQSVIEHIAYIRLRHPEIVKWERLDRHPAYVWMNLGLAAFGAVVTFVEVPYSNVGGDNLGTRATLAGTLLLGSLPALLGALLGKRFGRLIIGRKVSEHPASAMLGDDIRAPYVLAWVGLASTFISMGFYAYTVKAAAGWERLFTTFGGIICVAIAATCLFLIPEFVKRIRAYFTARDTVLTEAYAIMADEDEP
jgi:hypothetical protein